LYFVHVLPYTLCYMKIIQNENMPRANGHYTQCIEHQGILYLSGQLPIDPDTKEIPAAIEQQTLVALQNVEKILKAADENISAILQVRIYISDIALWDKVNAVYASFFGEHKPTRSIIPTGPLHYGAQIEIEALAVVSHK
jgi:2-iminobutanoate/2-iminopropanoate deaminase